MGEITCTPWRRYGHDRVYVARGDHRLGYLDRATGELMLADGAPREDVRAALVAGGFLKAPEPPPVPELEWAVTLPGDTATYRPGAGAREMAATERAAAPVRTTLARVLGVHTDERAWRRGAEGEEEVARRLRKLPQPWVVLHDLPIGERGANVDHLAIGPGGVFSMNTKNLSSNVWVRGDIVRCNGRRADYVYKARCEARRVSVALSAAAGAQVAVSGVVVVMAPELTVKEQPKDVAVVARREVRRWLERRPPVLTVEQVGVVERAARDPRTWGPRPPT